MASRDPSLLSTDLVARLHQPLRSSAPDPAPYVRFIERSGEPALELGCRDGDPLLDLRPRGLDVEERPWLLHWHTQDGFRDMATDADLVVRAVVTPAVMALR
jgi:hypothetical protein